MRALLLAALVAATTLAGCAGDDGDDVVIDDDLPHGDAVFLDADGNQVLALLPPDLVPGGALRYLPVSTFEPTIGATSDGCLFMTSFEGTGLPGGTAIMRSCDQGATWEDKSPWLVEGQARCFPNSNDPWVHVDQDTDRVFTSDLHALISSTLSYTDDGGDSWTCNPAGGGIPPGVHDHQAIATGTPRVLTTVGYPNMVYYCVNRVADSVCASSIDGGVGFGPFIMVYPGVEDGTLCGGLHGHVETDREGRVFLPKGQCGTPEVAVSEDDGLTWSRHVVSAETGVMGHEVRVAADGAHNVYATWIGSDGLPYLAVSTDHGASWSDARRVSPPDVTAAGFPAIFAGDEGRAAFVFVGTTAEGGFQDAAATWNAYVGIIVDAHTEPIVAVTTANDPADPIARGRCGDVRCGGLGDFIDVTIDPEGRPWGAFADMCHDACTEDGATSNAGGAIGFVGTLAVGPRLIGEGALPALAAVEADA